MSRPPAFFWQNMPAHHQAGALDRLSAQWGAPVTAVWAGGLSPQRMADGWRPLACASLRQITLPSEGWAEQVRALVADHAGAIHVFSGIGAYPPLDLALSLLRGTRSPKIGVIAETVFKEPLLHLPRYVKGRLAYAPFRDLIGAAFGIGEAGERFFRRMGLRDEVIFPYLYQSAGEVSPRSPGQGRIAFVGRLERYKGPDVLIEALAGCRDLAWRLDLYGDGAMQDLLRARAAAHGIGERLHFHGVIPSDQVVSRLCQADICVVPSRHEGWGMAATEAVRAGATVIVSEAAGAVDIARRHGVGAHFRSGDVPRLRDLLRERLLSPALVAREQSKAQMLAERMSAESVAAHLAAVLDHAFLGAGPRPQAPWMR